MFQSMTVTNSHGDSLTLPINNPSATGYNVLDISGLGPVDATINSSSAVTQDGTIFNGARKDSREINISLLYVPDGDRDVEFLRHETYKYFPEKEEVTLVFEAETRRVRTTGYVSSNSVSIFTENEGSSIAIECEDPWFRDDSGDGSEDVQFSNVTPLFYFSFPNDGDDNIFGTINNDHIKVINYEGEGEVGCLITLTLSGQTGNISIFNEDANQRIDIYAEKVFKMTGANFQDRDVIEISTVRMKKYVLLRRSGVEYNILNAINRDVSWITLSKGANTILYQADSGEDNISVSVTYETLFTGV